MKKEPTKKELKEWIKNERNVFLNSFFDLLNQRKELEQKVQHLQEQLKEANEVIKKFEKTEIGHKQKDGTYMLTVCGVIIDPEKRPTSALVQKETYFYDPRPLTKYLEKWGVK